MDSAAAIARFHCRDQPSSNTGPVENSEAVSRSIRNRLKSRASAGWRGRLIWPPFQSPAALLAVSNNTVKIVASQTSEFIYGLARTRTDRLAETWIKAGPPLMLQMRQPKIANSNHWPPPDEPAPPQPATGLTAQDAAALAALVATLAGAWDCEFLDKENDEMAAYLVARDWGDGNAAAFAVTRQAEGLVLTDRRMTADFGNHGARAAPRPATCRDMAELTQRLAASVGLRPA
jgi:hypothetical protein